MKSDKITFKNKKEAENLLDKSRKSIDEIDNELFDLISKRTSLAKDIAISKKYLEMPILDKNRENVIHEKMERLSEEKDLDIDVINQIVNMLTKLSKNEQEKILGRNINGQY